MLYYPCIYDGKTARINRKVSNKPMTKGEAEDYLKRHYKLLWLKCDAIPQPVTMFK